MCVRMFVGLLCYHFDSEYRFSMTQFQLVELRQGGDLGGTGGNVPLKKLGGGDGGAFIPPIFRKCLTNLQCKKG